MSRSLLVCLHCREPLAYAKPNGALQRLSGVTKRWEGERVMLLTCPMCGHERRVTVREERDKAA